MLFRLRERIALLIAPWLEPEPPTQEWLYEVQTGPMTSVAWRDEPKRTL